MRIGLLAVSVLGGCLSSGGSNLPCSVTQTTGTIPGVQITLDTPSCAMQPGTGGNLSYVIDVGSALSFAEGPHGACTPTSTTDPSSFTNLFVTGSGGEYCPACNLGTCAEDPGEQINIPAGTYAGSAQFPADAWDGPGGVNTPLGPPLPAGSYIAEVQLQIPSGMVSAELSITLE